MQCPNCQGGWLCEFHQAEGVRLDRLRAENLARILNNAREYGLYRYAMHREIESDETGTARERSEVML